MSIRTAVITGGTRGIGRAISLEFLRQGYRVFALYARDKDAATALQDQAKGLPGELVCLRGDLTQAEKMDEISSAILEQTEATGIHAFIHCAASGVHRPVEELRTKHLRWTFEINVFAFHELFHRLAPRLQSGASIIALTSAGSRKYLHHYAAVGSSKGALDALIRHYAVELAPRQIGVYLICPGMVETEALKAFPDRENRIRQATERTPSGKLTSAEEVATFAASLIALPHRQFTGQTFEMDGGVSILP